MNDFVEKLLAPTPPPPVPCPRCSRPTDGPKCDRCKADTMRTYVRMPKGTPNVR